MVLVGIIVAATVYFALPVRQAVDVSLRAQLSDAADGALQRMGRDLRLALPNSVRLTCGTLCVEFIPVRTAGRYRADASGAGCDTTTDATGSDELAFDVADSCFKSIGTVADDTTITNSDYLVLNNYGPDFVDQDAYAGTNRAQISLATAQGGATGRERINFSSSTFSRSLHDSPGRRFYIVTTPVSYVCDTGARTLTRFSGYAFGAAHTTVTGVLVANNVSGCRFDYVPNVMSQIGLLTLQLTLSRTASSGQPETVTLYHSVHVSNVP